MEYILDITDLDHLGRGIGKINNKIIFVPYTVPGEKIKVKIIKDKKNYSEGILIDIVKPSKKRISNLCDYYPFCGGCQILHLSYKNQIYFKVNKIKNIFEKFNLNNIIYKEIVNGKQFNYRNKVTLHNKNNKIGYYQDKTNNLIEIKKCLLLDDKINEKIKTINSNNNKIIIRSNGKDVSINSDNKLMHKINNKSFLVSNESFFQVNDGITKLLYDKIVEYISPTKDDVILDLYCGTGTIGIYISDYVKKVIGIEINKTAVKDANTNKLLNKVSNIEFICGDAGMESKKLKTKFDSIIVDPPRSGLDNLTIETIFNLEPKKIVYVSCDPMTLARDLNILKEKYIIVEVTPFDMFPNTYHVECVVLLNHK